MFSRKLDTPIGPQPDLAHSLPFSIAKTTRERREKLTGDLKWEQC